MKITRLETETELATPEEPKALPEPLNDEWIVKRRMAVTDARAH